MYVSIQELRNLQKNTANIRNISIMAHVDHGKTSLADCLLMSNGIVPESAIGERRYMDSRPDEQKRGITMKSSSILLKFSKYNEDYLINLIDTPGHVDFSSEVSCAVRLCDGVIIVVDVVEGICPQTRAVLYQAYIERMEMILFLNKIDRLINELGMDPIDAYHKMYNIVGQMNGLLNSFQMKEIENDKHLTDNSVTMDFRTDCPPIELHSMFNPVKGNVLFGSAIDGWAFGLKSFLNLYTVKLGLSDTEILSGLWGDYYYDSKLKKFSQDAISKNKKPCFVQFILDNIWHVYSTFRSSHKNVEELRKIYKFIGFELKPNIKLCDESSKQLIREFMGCWLPLYDVVLSAVTKQHPSPCSLSKGRIAKLMSNDNYSFEDLPLESKSLMKDFVICSSDTDAPVIVYVSKMMLVNSTDSMHQVTKPTQLPLSIDISNANPCLHQPFQDLNLGVHSGTNEKSENIDINCKSSTTKLIAFARVFSGSLTLGKKLYVLTPKFKHDVKMDHIDSQYHGMDQHEYHLPLEVTLSELYIMMGINFELCDYVPSGNIVGIGGLDNVILKSATISSTLYCPAFSPMTFQVNPIVKVSIEPTSYKDLNRLNTSLETLSSADSNLIYQLEDTGESVLYVTGEVHLQRCITDLENMFNITDFKVSTPIVPFKETMVVESCIGKDSMAQILPENYYNNLPSFIYDQFEECSVFDSTANCPISLSKTILLTDKEKNFLLKMRCICIPLEIREWIDVIQMNLQSGNIIDIDIAKNNLKTIINSLANKKLRREWAKIWDRIWFFGTKNAPYNLLTDHLSTKYDEIYFQQLKNRSKLSQNYMNFMPSGLFGVIYSGFCMAINSGPLMEEPITNACFIIEDIMLNDVSDAENLYQMNLDINTSGKLMSIIKQCCRCSFLASGSVRLSLPMYETTIYLNSNVLGKAYAVLGRREAKILREETLPDINLFVIVAQMPVIESFGFSTEILTKCRGLAQSQLSFSHWEVLDVDPFWVPGTEQEIELHGKTESNIQIHNIAMKYIRNVRKRKGMPTDEKIVEYAEKQRTFKKNK